LEKAARTILGSGKPPESQHHRVFLTVLAPESQQQAMLLALVARERQQQAMLLAFVAREKRTQVLLLARVAREKRSQVLLLALRRAREATTSDVVASRAVFSPAADHDSGRSFANGRAWRNRSWI